MCKDNKPKPIKVFLDEAQQKMIDNGIIETSDNISWIAVRQGDMSPRYSEDVNWIEWNNDLSAKKMHETPEVGRSMIMSPFNIYFTWKTTPISEIYENTKTKVLFRTKSGSNYLLLKGNMELFETDHYRKTIKTFMYG